MTPWTDLPFAGKTPIEPYSKLQHSSNLRNILRKNDDQLYLKAPDTNKPYIDSRKVDTYEKAVNCLVVRGQKHPVLLSVSVVNYYGYPLFEALVKPNDEIESWDTQVTGLNKKLWNKKANGAKLIDAEKAKDTVAELFDSGDTLIAHGCDRVLELLDMDDSDLVTIDTMELRRFRKNGLARKPGLKRTMLRYFDLEIQDPEYDTLENARSVMLLYRAFKKEYTEEQE